MDTDKHRCRKVRRALRPGFPPVTTKRCAFWTAGKSRFYPCSSVFIRGFKSVLLNRSGSGQNCTRWWPARAHGVTRPTNDGLATGRFDFIAHFGVRVEARRDTSVATSILHSHSIPNPVAMRPSSSLVVAPAKTRQVCLVAPRSFHFATHTT